jgi:hypothetical protein
LVEDGWQEAVIDRLLKCRTFGAALEESFVLKLDDDLIVGSIVPAALRMESNPEFVFDVLQPCLSDLFFVCPIMAIFF